MRAAYAQALEAAQADEVPVGAVIVQNDTIIARAHNQIETLQDPTAHAEMIAITQAASVLGSKVLTDTTVYVTLEPCPMCAMAMVLAKIDRVAYATDDPRTGAAGSIVNILQNDHLNHRVDVTTGIMQAECSALLKDFFRAKR
jgi:tRNA(adenine34) deaminase